MFKWTSVQIARLLTLSSALVGTLFLLAPECAFAAEIPSEFRGTWCAQSADFTGEWGAYTADGADCDGVSVSISSSTITVARQPLTCTIQSSSRFDVCPWGMIFKDREQARQKRPGQINPWSPGFHLVFECSGAGNAAALLAVDWVLEKGSIVGGVPKSYRCPWNRK